MADVTRLVNVYKKYQKKGLVVFAMHRGHGAEAAIAALARSKKWPFPVYNAGFVKGNDSNTNPQTFIFDHEGNLTFDSRFDTLAVDKAANKIAASAPDWLVGARRFKKLGSQAKKVISRKGMGAVLTEMEEKVKSAEGDEKEEAVYLKERIDWYLQWLTTKSKEKIEAGYPTQGLDLLKEIGKVFKGHSSGEKANAEIKAKKEDPRFKAELAAEKVVKGMEAAFITMKPKKGDEDDSKWLRRNARNVGKIRSAWKKIKDKFPATMVYQRAQAMVVTLGIG